MENKEIKFRGLTKKTKNWIFGQYIKNGKDHYIFEDFKDTSFLKKFTQVILESIGEFTGLFCHGNEVYEKDLLQRNSSDGKGSVTGEVYFDQGQFRIKWHHKDKGWNDSLYIHLDDCEHIGNAYQNPELLKWTP